MLVPQQVTGKSFKATTTPLILWNPHLGPYPHSSCWMLVGRTAVNFKEAADMVGEHGAIDSGISGIAW